MIGQRKRIRRAVVCLCAAAALLVSGCSSPPLSVKRAGRDVTRRTIASNVAATGELSGATQIVLRRHGLAGKHKSDPVGEIAVLHGRIAEGQGGSDEYFALAELSFQYAEKLERKAYWQARQRDALRFRGAVRRPPRYAAVDYALVEEARSYFRAAVVYAFTFLFTDDPMGPVARIDPRSRIAADVYNRALAEAFSTNTGYLMFQSGAYALPFGSMHVEFDQTERLWGNRLLVDFLPTDEFEVKGLANRYRRPGLGAPLAARTVPVDQDDPAGYLVAARAVVSATAVLLISDPRAQLYASEITARLQISPGSDAAPISYADRTLPLEAQPSAALAASLQESDVWRGKFGIFLGRAVRFDDEDRLFGWEPRLPGQIPVVFVHGTTSTPAVWANMTNDLKDDPLIRDRYQFLFFAYESGNPILYSSMLLRRSLTHALKSLDPQETDACLREMVVIGHSQGGLLAKAIVIDSGTKFWDANFETPFEETKFSPATKNLLREAVFVEPAPFVDRVVFISTPHRGSYLASSDVLRRLASWAIRFPMDLASVTSEVAGLSDDPDGEYNRMRVMTSIDNMSPSHRMIRTISKIPVAERVHSHSIISVKGDGPYEDGDDGVVKYQSAHIEEVDSELVVRDSHSTQANPHTIEEVRRILRQHASGSQCASAQ